MELFDLFDQLYMEFFECSMDELNIFAENASDEELDLTTIGIWGENLSFQDDLEKIENAKEIFKKVVDANRI